MIFILASASPRRHELLKNIRSDFSVIPSQIEEILDPQLQTVGEQVESLAQQKAEDVAQSQSEPCLVLGADTVVSIDNQILGKPKDQDDAFSMLSLLSGKWHEVITGYTLIRTHPIHESRSAHCVSRVKMRDITAQEIRDYIATGEPMDKAGSYAIQGEAKVFIETIEGSYDNIVGLPVEEVEMLLNTLT